MRNFYFLMLSFFSLSAFSQSITFDSPSLQTRLLECNIINGYAKNNVGLPIKIDANDNQIIEVDEALIVFDLDLGNVTPLILSLSGMEYFVNITKINLALSRPSNTDLAAMFPNLRDLNCASMGSNVININISGLDLNSLICDANSAMIPYLTGSQGLAQFTNLRILSCRSNAMAALNVSTLPLLRELYCDSNQLTQLNVSGLQNLEVLQATENLLSSIDLSTTPALKQLLLSNNSFTNLQLDGLNLQNLEINNCSNLTNLDLTNLPQLMGVQAYNCALTSFNVDYLPNIASIDVSNNSLTTLIIIGFPNLLALNCSVNNLSTLYLAGCESLIALSCALNQIQTLDISTCTELRNVDCSQNSLQTLFVKNGAANTDNFNIDNNPTLTYICADDFELQSILTKVVGNGYTNCNVNSYCSFAPAENSYTLSGTQRFDSDSNGCNATDAIVPNVKYKISSSQDIGYAVSAASGNYNLPLSAGTHTVKPLFENNFFVSSPTERVVTFPGTMNNVTQDFCISSNGNFPDIEVILIPINAARPGFDADYRLVYRNKGNKIHEGTVSLIFDNNTTDLISAIPAVSNQSGNVLNWNYVNLLPFESREISFVLNLNAATEIPALNSGDILAFQASISSQLTDVSPEDNNINLNQDVVNSFDPNDKTCVQGTSIPLSMVGNYVTYIIRFENTGTFNAQNVVVSDVIDSSKFNLASMIPLSGSHPFVSRIVGTNRVEFVFENIELPFDDANNDGFVAFKIKTIPNLEIGNTFANSASIYFDYNFPVITDAAITEVVSGLSTNDFELSSLFTVFPNPARSSISVISKHATEVRSASIYNSLGQLLLSVTNLNEFKNIDVSFLTKGAYIVKVYTDKGSSSAKFIKQ